ANFRESGPDWRLPRNEGSASGGAALLAVPTQEQATFFANAVDVGRLIAHVAAVVNAGVVPANVVAHDYEDVGLLCLSEQSRGESNGQKSRNECKQRRTKVFVDRHHPIPFDGLLHGDPNNAET